MAKGKLYLIPTTLGGESTTDIIPEDVRVKTISIRHFVVEDIKTARRFLRKLDRTFPIDDCTFQILNKRTDPANLNRYLKPIREGFDMGVMSEAGCPGVADPGAELVARAHQQGVWIMPLVGPSSILLTLMGSGFNGQEFTFHGYLPKDRKERIYKLKDFEMDTLRTGKTHLFMDTPFRNMNVLEDLLNELTDTTMLCIASNITLPDQDIRTMTIKEWRDKAYDLSKKPAMFGIGKFQ